MVCKGCGLDKDKAEFYTGHSKCKKCVIARVKARSDLPEVKESKRAYDQGRYANPEFREAKQKQNKAWLDLPGNRERKVITDREYREDPVNAKRIRLQKQVYYQENREEIIAKVKEYAASPENREKIRERGKVYRSSPESKKRKWEWGQLPHNRASAARRTKRWLGVPGNKEHKKKWSRLYNSSPAIRAQKLERYATDIEYRLSCILRSRFKYALKNPNTKRQVSAVRNLGCTIPELIKYIEDRFETGMSWKNYGNREGQWSIDHIRPFASFKLSDPEQQRIAVHYTNLQPLWHRDNLSKGAKWSG